MAPQRFGVIRQPPAGGAAAVRRGDQPQGGQVVGVLLALDPERRLFRRRQQLRQAVQGSDSIPDATETFFTFTAKDLGAA
jgi:hypothetical protein